MSKQKQAIPTFKLTTEQQAELNQLKETYGTINSIPGTDENGNEVVMFLRNLDYQVRKSVFKTLSKDVTLVIEAGEMILLACYVGGTNLYENENTRLEAALQAVELFDFNASFTLLKKS